MLEKLEIRREGKLFATHWIYDKSTGTGSYVTSDVTIHAAQMLFEKCELEDGITLRDVLLLLNTNILVFNAILGNACRDLVAEGLNLPSDQSPDIAYLELYWHLSTFEDQLSGNIFPAFHGVGKPDESGQRINYAIEMTSVNRLADLPLKLNPAYRIFKEDPENAETGLEEYQFNGPEFCLGHILHGILWELSFFGGPESRDRFVAEVNRRVEEISKPVDVNDVITKENPDTNLPSGEV